MEFYKLEANGNDFIITILDKTTDYNISLLCNRYKGIGADGYINIDNKFNVSIFNSDGSKANMCGNGLRCLTKLLNFLTNKDTFTYYLDGSEILANIEDNEISITMPSPMMIKQDNGYYVNLLNNHYIELVKNINSFSFNDTHIQISNDNKCNVHAVEITNTNQIKIKSFEYGVGETLSCGSGSMCAFYVCYMLNKVNKEVNVISSGGKLTCKCENGKYILKGNANYIYKGEYYGL